MTISRHTCGDLATWACSDARGGTGWLRGIGAVLLGLSLLGLFRDVVGALIHISLVVVLVVLPVKVASHLKRSSTARSPGPPLAALLERKPTVIGFIVAGLVIGALARLIKPGKQNLGLVATLLLGLAGSVIGGLIANLLGTGGIFELNVLGFVVAVVAAVLLIGVAEGATGRSRNRV
jgi:uncharacterized membrane protein YeaQ/YmgE (transglycosylase-associated protein family)